MNNKTGRIEIRGGAWTAAHNKPVAYSLPPKDAPKARMVPINWFAGKRP